MTATWSPSYPLTRLRPTPSEGVNRSVDAAAVAAFVLLST